MMLFFIYVIQLEPRNIGRKLNNQVNSSVDYISASGEAKILIILTISVLFNACTLLTDGYALKEYHKLAPEVKQYYYHNSFEFQCFYVIPYLMTFFDILSLLFIIIPVVVVVSSYYRNYTCIKTEGPARRDRARSTSTEILLKEEHRDDDTAELGQSEVLVAEEGAASGTCDDSQQQPTKSRREQATVEVRSKKVTLNTNDKDTNTMTMNVNWSILLYTLLSPFSCIAIHAYHVIIAFIDNAYHASSVLLLFIIVLFIHVVVFQKIYYYVCKLRNSKKHSDCCKNFCWTMLILFCFFLGVLTLGVIIGLTVSTLILIPINNAIDNAPNNIYIIYQGSVAVIAALVTFQVFFRETNSVAEVFIKARDKMIQEKSHPRVQEEDNNNERGAQPDSKDDKTWEKMSEKEKELRLATVFLEYVFRKTNNATSLRDTQTPVNQRDPPADSTPRTPASLVKSNSATIPPKEESPPKSTLSLVSPARLRSDATPPSAASQPQEIPGSTVTASPTALEQFHTPPIQPQPQPQPQGISDQEMSAENVSHQVVTIAEVHESSEGLSSTTNPEPRGNPPTACPGKPM